MVKKYHLLLNFNLENTGLPSSLHHNMLHQTMTVTFPIVKGM